MIDSVKTTLVGVGGIWVTWIEWLPPLVRVAVGIATFFYMFWKARNEYLRYEKAKNN